MTRTTRVIGVVALLAAVGCGTTVRMDGATSAGALTDGGVTSPDVAGPVASSPTGAAPGITDADTQPGAVSTATGVATTSGVTTPTRAANRTPVEVGILVAENGAAYTSAFGVELDAGDPRAQTGAIIKAINSQGGLGGRPIVPVYAVFDVTSAEPTATQGQRACDLWTQDHRVVAAINSMLSVPPEILAACLHKRQTPFITTDIYAYDATVFGTLSHFFGPAALNLTRLSDVLVDQLVSARFFPSGAKIGVLYYDVAEQRRPARKALPDALKRHGLRIHQEAAISYPGSTGETGTTVAQFKNATLRFNSEGVTHVLALGHGMSFFFMTEAESQVYRPMYGLTSLDESAILLQGVAPEAQLVNTLGVGWRPTMDVDTAHDPGGNAAAARCRAILAAADIPPTTRAAEGGSYGFCDSLFLLQAAFRVAPAVERSQLVPAIESLGTSYLSPLTMATRLAPGRHDGAAAVRHFRYRRDCACFTYVARPVAA